MDQTAVVLVVEDDKDMRHSLVFMLRANGFRAEGFGTSEELLEVYDANRPGCLVLDLELPNMSGLELIEHLRSQGCCHHPFLVISGHGEVAAAVTAMHSGAIDYLEKPFEHERFLEGVKQAVERDAEARRRRLEVESVSARVSSLTQREREVMELVIAGKLTKQIAKELGISPKTVEVHRSHLTRKMQVESVAQLVALMANYAAIQSDPLVVPPPLPSDGDGHQTQAPSSGS